MHDDEQAPAESIRGELRASTDPRARRTRRRILAGVEQLAADGQEVTVTAVLAASGVRRATFYTHFADLEEIALQLQQEAFDAIVLAERTLRQDDPLLAMRTSLHALVAHYAARRALYAAVFAMPVPRGAQARVVTLMRSRIREQLISDDRMPTCLDVDLTAEYIAHAATGLVAAWVLGDVTADEDTLVTHLIELMPQWMHRRVPDRSVGGSDGTTREETT